MNPDTFAGPLSDNVKNLREAQGMTQAALAKKAEVPRATLSLLESGSANPTLQVVLRVSNALGVRLEELLEPPPSDTVLYRSDELPVKARGRSSIKKLLPRSLEGVELEELSVPAGQTLVGMPHTVGTREYLIVQTGRIELHLSGEMHEVNEGDVVIFRGHQKHSYRNPGRKNARAFSVIAHGRSEV